VGVIVKVSDKISIAVLSVYVPPKKSFTLSDLNKILITDNILIIGDLNAKSKLWGSPNNDSKGKIIERFVEENNLVVLNKGQGTRINHTASLSHLDIALCSKNLSSILNLEVLEETWGSDHFP